MSETDSEHQGVNSGVQIVAAQDARIRIQGRFANASISDAPQAVEFGYPGVSFGLCVRARRVTARAYSSSGQSRMLTRVAGDAVTIHTVPASLREFVLWQAPGEAETRCLEWIHLTETWIGRVTLLDFQVDGEILEPFTDLPSRQLLLIGDSITCGEAVRRAPGRKTPAWWDVTQSYGAVLAQLLGARAEYVCYGGRGLIRDWQGKTDVLTGPQFFELAVAGERDGKAWDLARSQPQVIVIALGTNDFSLGLPDFPEREAYVTAYLAFIRRIRDVYPTASLFLTEGPMLKDEPGGRRPKTLLRDYLKEVGQRAHDAGVHVVPAVSVQGGDERDAHPTPAQQRAFAEELASGMRPHLSSH